MQTFNTLINHGKCLVLNTPLPIKIYINQILGYQEIYPPLKYLGAPLVKNFLQNIS